MELTKEQWEEIQKAIREIEYGEITIKAQGKNSFVDIIVSNRKRIHTGSTEFNRG